MNWLEKINHTPESASNSLTDMMGMEGWKVLQAYLENGINIIENEIWDKNVVSLEKFHRLKDRRQELKDLLQAPEKLTIVLAAHEPEVDNFDPYR